MDTALTVIETVKSVLDVVKGFFADVGNLFVQVPDMLLNMTSAADLLPGICADVIGFCIVVRLIVVIHNKNAGD